LGVYQVWLGWHKIWRGEQAETFEKQSWTNILFQRANIHILLILMSGLVIAGNLALKNTSQASANQGTVFSQLLGMESEDILDENTLSATQIKTQDGSAISANDWGTLPEEALEDLDTSSLALEGGALVQPQLSPSGAKERNQIEFYLVQGGDTLAAIAEKFGVSVNTLLWENNLTTNSRLQPGQKLTILPVSGLTYRVKSGDNLQKIATTYKSNIESIIAINGLSSASSIKAGQAIIIPGGIKPKPAVATNYNPVRGTGSDDYYITHDSTLAGQKLQSRPASAYGGHKFPWGQCTWYVAQKRYVPWSGNANQWINNARAWGYAIGNSPRAGAILVTRESWWGHVVFVESFTEKTVTFSESNYKGLGVITRRTLNLNDRRVIGYIY